MKSFVIFYFFVITTINPVVNSHENHDHKIYNWSNSKNKTLKKDSTSKGEKLEVIKNKTTINTNTKSI